MSDLGSEHDSAIALIISEYSKLKKLDPNHDLLKYVCDVCDTGFSYSPDQRTRQEFVDKYAPEDNTPAAVMLSRYYVDLKKATNKISEAASGL